MDEQLKKEAEQEIKKETEKTQTPEVKEEPRIQVVEGNIGALSVKFLSEINFQLKRIADSLDQKEK